MQPSDLGESVGSGSRGEGGRKRGCLTFRGGRGRISHDILLLLPEEDRRHSALAQPKCTSRRIGLSAGREQDVRLSDVFAMPRTPVQCSAAMQLRSFGSSKRCLCAIRSIIMLENGKTDSAFGSASLRLRSEILPNHHGCAGQAECPLASQRHEAPLNLVRSFHSIHSRRNLCTNRLKP